MSSQCPCYYAHTTVSYRIVSYRIVSYRIVSYRIVSYRIVSYRIVSYRIVSYRIVSYRIVSYRIVSYRIVSYRIVSYRIVSYRIVSYRIITFDSIDLCTLLRAVQNSRDELAVITQTLSEQCIVNRDLSARLFDVEKGLMEGASRTHKDFPPLPACLESSVPLSVWRLLHHGLRWCHYHPTTTAILTTRSRLKRPSRRLVAH